ncbi:MAG: FtsX-like permease family protein, partial [Propionibacteriaceae bacterium]
PDVRTALVELRQHPGRLAAVILAISISVAFVVAALVFTTTETHAIGQSVSARTSASDVVVEPAGALTPDQETSMSRVPGVADVEAGFEGFTDFASPRGAGQLMLDSLPTDSRLQWATLSAGRWPATATELAIDRSTAQQYELSVGQRLMFAGYEGPDRAMEITGITDQSRSLFSGLTSSGFVAPTYFTQHPDLLPSRYLVLGDGSVPPQQLADAIRTLMPADSTVQTSAQATAAQLNELTRGADVFRYLLLVFGAIALLVGAIIITNTFTILVAQRRRQIGLLRAVGASTAQVRRGVLAEAAVIGFTGALLGVALGLGIAAIAAAISGSLASGLQIQPAGLLGAAALGLVVTVLAAMVPAARATRVPPLEALRPVADQVTAKRGSARLRNVAFLVIAAGALLDIVALRAPSHNLVLAIGGSMVLAVGILLAAPAFLPLVLRAAGRLTGRAGPVARLAGTNTVRNPGRAAATCVALMLGVGLIVTLQVGSASIKSTLNDTLDAELPVDVIVSNPSGALSPAVVSAVREVDGLKATTVVPMARVGVRIPDHEDQQVRVAGLTPDAAQVVAAGFEALTDQVVLAQSATLKSWGIKAGDSVNLTYDRRSVAFTAEQSDVAPQGVVVVTQGRLAQLDPQARVGAIWGAATSRSEAGDVMAAVRQASGQQPGLELGGSLQEAAALDKVLDSLLAVATGLLGVAVLIALIGVGNTLGLSVIERTRESALLRALGLQRRDLRLMLAVEAALLALVGAVVGIAAGVLFGWIGTAAVVKESNLDGVHFAMSATQTGAVVLVAILAGVLASVIPGRRAALASPTQALAEV